MPARSYSPSSQHSGGQCSLPVVTLDLCVSDKDFYLQGDSGMTAGLEAQGGHSLRTHRPHMFSVQVATAPPVECDTHDEPER